LSIRSILALNQERILRWPGEDTRLQAAYASSSSLEEISRILKRSPDEIVSRLVALKFLPTRNPYEALSAEYLRRSLR
jgi:hypothetical protein